MSMPPLEAKWMIFSCTCAGQERDTHRTATSSFSRTTAEPQTGQVFGASTRLSSPVLFSFTTDMTWGMTSPALSMTTVSPARMSFLSISSQLCRVDLDTVTPPTFTGSSTANGVMTPVLPTLPWMSIIRVIAWWAWNL